MCAIIRPRIRTSLYASILVGGACQIFIGLVAFVIAGMTSGLVVGTALSILFWLIFLSVVWHYTEEQVYWDSNNILVVSLAGKVCRSAPLHRCQVIRADGVVFLRVANHRVDWIGEVAEDEISRLSRVIQQDSNQIVPAPSVSAEDIE